ncbi:hypothetical protein CC80DRAFT_501123 [Byssothecium circinans]|uniref:NACHT domain-containing protein n=1 Tax=Byssothecium circinans TaxID=147558 RepID=A0A6A5U7N2_9PLEO|nr:hypothetical protein CC80DRAFT_501123 [Byssothecium circinans]
MSQRGQKRTLNRCLSVVKKCNERLRPYFDALNVIASANDTAAFTYGAFRVILELASGFPTFFEKLLSILGRLADTFPQYGAIIGLFEGTPPTRMHKHLENVYVDLMSFLRIAARVFTASNGRVKRPLQMIATVIWKPCDAQFASIMNSMDEHRQYVMDELEIHQAQQSKEAERAAAIERKLAQQERTKADESRAKFLLEAKQTEEIRKQLDDEIKASSLHRFLQWLAPPRFAIELEKCQEEREEGTAQWIFTETAFTEWKDSTIVLEDNKKWRQMPPWVLWVHAKTGESRLSSCSVPRLTWDLGNPGSGKTILASSVVEEFTESEALQPCYFFFKYDDPGSWHFESALRSALAQILHWFRHDNDILNKFSFARSDMSASSGQETATPKELLALLRICAAEIGQITIVLDGIDECKAPEQVVRQLKELVTITPVKVICFSRTSVDTLQRQVKQQQQIRVGRNTSSSDIGLYLIHQLQNLVEDRKLPPSAAVEQLADTLVRGADGMFLWAKLMIGHLNSLGFSPNQRLITINSVQFPEGLDAMYDRILTLIMGSDGPSIELVRRVLLWLCYVIDLAPLSREFLHSATQHDQCPADVTDLDEFGTAVVSVCGGLVECPLPVGKFPNIRTGPPQILPPEEDATTDASSPTIRFTHLTAKEYLKQQRWVRSTPSAYAPLVPDAESANAEMSSLCLRYLLTHPNSHSPDDIDGVQGYISYAESFEAYTVRYWAKHIEYVCDMTTDLGRHGTLLDAMARFLDQPLAIAFWVQRLYKDAVLPLLPIEILKRLVPPFTSSYLPDVQALGESTRRVCADIDALNHEWGDKLGRTPSLMRADAVQFPKNELQSRIAEALGVSTATCIVPKSSSCTSKEKVRCLASISSTSNDGSIVGTLTIYASAEYEKFWRSMDAATAFHQAEDYCDGWTATYEVWSVESRKRQASMDVPIPPSEIRILIRQSFRQNPFKAQPTGGQYSVNGRTTSPLYRPVLGQGTVRTVDKSFEMSFPMVIGPDCLAFVILRTVYSIRPTNSPSSYTCTSALLPLDFLEHFATTWGPSRRTFEPNHHPDLIPNILHISWYDWYFYSVSFSASGKYIAFSDYQVPCKTQVAVFEIEKDPRIELRLINWTTARIGPPKVKEMIFHPQVPILGFHGEGKTWIWQFSEASLKPIHLESRFDTLYRHTSANTGFVPDSIAFSACGNFLLVRKGDKVDVLALSTHVPSLARHNQIVGTATPVSATSDLAKTSSGNEHLQKGSSLGSGAVLAGSQLISTTESGGSMQALLVTTNDNEIRITHATDFDATKSSLQVAKQRNELQLLSLPTSFDLKQTSISLKLPTESAGSLKIIFNRLPSEGYSLSEGRGPQFGSIVEKNVSSIAQVNHWTKEELSEDTVDEPNAKRFRID